MANCTGTCRKEALQALLAKVDAGDCSNDGIMFRVFGDLWLGCFDAYNGSLDAAKALHEAVLPSAVIWDQSRSYFGYEVSILLSDEQFDGCSKDNPARAWLLAILKALIAQEPAAS